MIVPNNFPLAPSSKGDCKKGRIIAALFEQYEKRGLRPSSLDLDREAGEGGLDRPDLRALDQGGVGLGLLVAHLEADGATAGDARAGRDVEGGTQVDHASLGGLHPVDESADVRILAETLSDRNIADRPVFRELGSGLRQVRLDCGVGGDFLDQFLVAHELRQESRLLGSGHVGDGESGSGRGEDFLDDLGSGSGLDLGHENLRLFLLCVMIEERARNISISLFYD